MQLAELTCDLTNSPRNYKKNKKMLLHRGQAMPTFALITVHHTQQTSSVWKTHQDLQHQIHKLHYNISETTL